MPIYPYRCDDSGQEFAKQQKLSDVPLTSRPSCHQSALVNSVSAAGFWPKGAGRYETNFKPGRKKNLASCDADGACQSCPATLG
ncbi:FmdB family zinc ribbon protein [Aeromonas simiae]|uniref:Zinc ribbon domain-containing protein n=1 Tax=Aeromonas simiae TaxID=218936 RepID=A0A5J6WVR9_9GAMM|nr:zinc ribbon domain-containing protein [Aeromonas simiae]QFI55239.1 zinc ribbon domain-containing protein [Aeromonas simiae]